MKIARSIYEAELNILWLKDHPEEIRDFVDYNVIQQKQLFDLLTPDEQSHVPNISPRRKLSPLREEIGPTAKTDPGECFSNRNQNSFVVMLEKSGQQIL
jgi:N-acetyl-anhydromuramyl-L-alanine amidase AmpD